MGLGFADGESQVTAQKVVTTLRCGNPDCNAAVGQAHLMGLGFFRILHCTACGRGSEYENTSQGWTVKLLAGRFVPKAMKRG